MKRDIWEQLKQWKVKNDRKPLIIKGARQTGKTFILQLFGREFFRCAHYLNFEKEDSLASIFEKNLSPERILQELSFHLNTAIDKDNDILIFDEIQNVPRALTSLKYFQEEMPQLAVCAAGSLLGLHLGAESFPVGKVEFLDLFPLSFMEFLRGIKDEKGVDFLENYQSGGADSIPEIIHEHLWNQLKIYFVVGGLPEVVKAYAQRQEDMFTAFSIVRKKQEDLILTYNADMAKHSGKQNAMQIERVWRNVPAQLAKEQDGSASRFRIKGILPNISRYAQLIGTIDWLVAAGLIIKAYVVNSAQLPLSAYIKENFFKLYLFDVGLLGALSQLPPKTILDYDYGTYKGYFAENFAAQEFKSAGETDLYGWREKTAEVEFLREINGRVIPIEIKSGWVTQSKSIKVFAQKYHPPYQVITSAKNIFIDPIQKRHYYPLYFLSHMEK